MTKTISRAVKLGMAAAVSVAALAFAGPALAQVNSGAGSDGDLFLVVFDQTAGLSYVEDLGVTTAAVASDSAVDTAATAATGGVLSTSGLPGYSGSFAADSTLSSYLAAHSGDTYSWEVIADSQIATNTTAQNFLLTTAAKPVGSTFSTNSGNGMSGTGGDVDSAAGGLGGDINSWSGGLVKNGINGRSSALTAFSNSSQYPGQSGDPAALTWYGNGSLIPAVTWTPSGGSSVSNFYLASDATFTNNPAGNAAIFLLGTATLAANGTLTFGGSAVPIPAALWLLGSGLLGLAGVARRRIAA